VRGSQRNPIFGLRSSVREKLRVAFDDSDLYFGLTGFDWESQHIVVTENQPDGGPIDAFHDGLNAFLFATSPTWIEMDAHVSEAGQMRRSARVGGGACKRDRTGFQKVQLAKRMHFCAIETLSPPSNSPGSTGSRRHSSLRKPREMRSAPIC